MPRLAICGHPISRLYNKSLLNPGYKLEGEFIGCLDCDGVDMPEGESVTMAGQVKAD